MVVNGKVLQGEGIENKIALEDAAMKLAELILRAYERELDKKGETKDEG